MPRSAVDGCEIGFAGLVLSPAGEKSFLYPGQRDVRDSRSRAFTKLPYTYETIPSPAYVAKKVRGNPCVAIYLSNTI